MNYHESFHQELQRIATDAKALYRVAGKVCSMCRRPPSIDYEDHQHDAITVALEVIRNTPVTFTFPLEIEPEYWLVRSVRRSFHSRSFYFREFSWARRRIAGHLGDQSESPADMGAAGSSQGPESAANGYTGGENRVPTGTQNDSGHRAFHGLRVGGSAMSGCTQTDLYVEDLCDVTPETCHPMLRLLAQGATRDQVTRILGKQYKWADWRMKRVHEAIAKLPEPQRTALVGIFGELE